MLMRYLLAGFLGFLLSGVWFGMQLWLTHIFLKKGHNRLTYFSPLLAACIPTVLILCLSDSYYLNLSALSSGKLWALTAATLLVTCLIKGLSDKKQRTAGKQELPWMCMEAAFVEIAQRLMMQSFLMYLLDAWGMRRGLVHLPQCPYLVCGNRHSGDSRKADHGKGFRFGFGRFLCFLYWLRLRILPVRVHCFFADCPCGRAVYHDKVGTVIRRSGKAASPAVCRR